MIELGIFIIMLAAVGVVCGVASIVIACEADEYEYKDYHKDDPEYKGGNEDGRKFFSIGQAA